MVKFSNKLVPKNRGKKSEKRRDRVKKKQDGGKFWTKNQDCPSKSGTVGEDAHYIEFLIYMKKCHAAQMVNVCL